MKRKQREYRAAIARAGSVMMSEPDRLKYSESEARDAAGRWTVSAGGIEGVPADTEHRALGRRWSSYPVKPGWKAEALQKDPSKRQYRYALYDPTGHRVTGGTTYGADHHAALQSAFQRYFGLQQGKTLFQSGTVQTATSLQMEQPQRSHSRGPA